MTNKPLDPPPTKEEIEKFRQYQAQWTSQRAGTYYGLLETRPRLNTFVYNLRLNNKSKDA